MTVHRTDSDAVLAFSKREVAADGSDDVVIVVINLDSHATREATVALDLPALGLGWQDTFAVRDEITGQTWSWGQYNYVRLDPRSEPAHVLTIRRSGL